ncbi:FKBP-type peptidyl-prolyl cis-trans isomerase [Mucilaginibacter boryungensis]|uniref:peptidylprolyl isomerase n=1 Tax=Mucilaginibacter boryungensis TaxID=768480 RepID=A0ABR9XEM4_9SPHI|nr:FKBP-type peptidyl-prolyl cis-trans isomerase [Mucilaginibacter boryungensis]MBE9665630.1 FKBP-type peptidyl-prolyl cis-trans isomerase [Mucilaginibacter boryungensis]
MRKILFTLSLFCVTVAMYSCRKVTDVNIKQYDEQQIQTYISANGITGMNRDLSSGDTTGMYYKILTPGTGAVVKDSSLVSLVFTLRSFDGQFIAEDTIVNHVYNYLGHIGANNLPQGVRLGILNILKNKGGRMRLLVPSRLGYGTSGFGTGSSDGNNRIKGNQGLDYYINLVNNTQKYDPRFGTFVGRQDAYDDISVKNYITANNLTGYTKTASGLWYKETQAGSGAAITPTSIVTIQYTGTLFNGLLTSEQYNNSDGTGVNIDLANDTRFGLVEGIQLVKPGAKLSLIMPSRLAFGGQSYTDNTIPIFSCMRYDINVLSVQ